MPKFSIIVPVYNVEKYIKKCLDSIESQTFKDYEIIVVNDGTKDNSMDIVNKYNVESILLIQIFKSENSFEPVIESKPMDVDVFEYRLYRY